MYTYQYPHPAVTADVAAFSIENDGLRLLLIRRGRDPHRGKWALPGGFIEYDEDAAAVPPASFLGRPVHRYALLARSARCEADHGCADAGCVIFTTSGTTKAPKFVLHSQRVRNGGLWSWSWCPWASCPWASCA